MSRAGNSTVPRRPPAQLPLFTVAPPAEPAGVAVAVRLIRSESLPVETRLTLLALCCRAAIGEKR